MDEDLEPVDWLSVPEVVNTQDASPMKPAVVSRGAEEKVVAADKATARKMGFLEATASAFVSGDNSLVQMAYDLDRIDGNGPVDPAWKQGGHKQWIADQGANIPVEQAWRYTQTRNKGEAAEMLSDAQANAKAQNLLNLRAEQSVGVPFSTFVARGLAGVIDVDLPVTLISGGLGAGVKAGINATKMGRLASGAAAGSIAGAAIGAGSYFADPNSDWTSIPAAMLFGLGLGVAGGALKRGPMHAGEKVSEPANAKLDDVINEYDEALQGEMVRDRPNDIRNETFPDTDQYGATSAQVAEAAELAKKAVPAAEPVGGLKKLEIKPEDVEGVRPEDVIDPRAPRTFSVGETSGEAGSSVGARQQGVTGGGIADIENPKLQTIAQNAQADNARTGHITEWEGDYSNLRARSDAAAKATRRWLDVVNASPLASDFGRMMRTGSAVFQNMAYHLFENASGIVRNNRSGAMIMDNYQKQILGNFLPYHDAFTEFAGARGHGMWKRTWDSEIRRNFDEDVVRELQARKYSGTLTNDQAVKKAADAVDATFAKEVEVGKGRKGEASWKGFEKVDPESGYFPQKWLGAKMQKLISKGIASKKDIIEAVTEAYRAQHAAMTGKDAGIWASAMVNGTLRRGEGLTTNLVSVLQSDGRGMLEETLRANSIPQKEIDRLIKGLTGSMETAGAPGQTKRRIDVDLRFTASNGVRMIDLVDTDINSIVGQRARRTAGQGALARKGILSKQDWDDMVEAGLAEQNARGANVPTGTGVLDKATDIIDKDKHLTKEHMDELYTYFSGAPLAGGISPAYSRMKKLTNLALLNQLGLTQMAEWAVSGSAVGWKRFLEHAGEAFNERLGNPKSPLVQELEHFNIFVPEERMFRDDLNFEHEKASPNASEYMQRFDNMLNKASRLQGYTSGFYEVRKIQQRVAYTSGTSKLFEGFKRADEQFSFDRLRDIGIDTDLAKRLKEYADNGTVTYNENGRLQALNLKDWKLEDVEDFTLAMNRSTNQLVQKAMAGESSILFHRDGVASLFLHLKSFPLLAMEKQGARNLMMADQTALSSFITGLVMAGAVYAGKQVANNKSENLTAQRIAMGAFGMSNMTGWIPMWTDPVAGMLGLDSMQTGGGKYGANSIISLPASITTLDKMGQLPGAALHAAGAPLGLADFTSGDVRVLQALPLVGNAYGFSFMLNALKTATKGGSKSSKADTSDIENLPQGVDTAPEIPDLGVSDVLSIGADY